MIEIEKVTRMELNKNGDSIVFYPDERIEAVDTKTSNKIENEDVDLSSLDLDEQEKKTWDKFNLDIPQEELEVLADRMKNDGELTNSKIFPDYKRFSIQFDKPQQPQFSEISIDKDGNFEQTVTIPERCRGCPYLPGYFLPTIETDDGDLTWTVTTSEDTSDITINTKGEIV